jgi:ribonuclease BN (tRNA processing enzyme)
MRLTVLGGSAAGPNAGMGCSGYLIQEGDSAVVLDLGPGIVPELKRHIDPRVLDGIVISHAHLDHTLDIGTMRYALKYGPSPARTPVSLWVPPGTKAMLEHLALAYSEEGEPASAFYEGVLDVGVYDPSQALNIGPLTISFSPTVHYVPAWAMRVSTSAGTATLGYTADTGPSADLGGLLSGVRVLIAESAYLDPGSETYQSRGHLTASEAGQLATRVGCQTLVLTHIWEELGYDRIREAAASSFSGQIAIARPGLLLDV